MSKMIDSIDLAYYIINSNKCKDLNQLKLQKLLYYIQAWHLVFRDEKLIDDSFEAWVHGPVSRKVWDHFKPYVHKEISPNDSNDIKLENYLDLEQIEIINDVLEEYGDKTSYHLECLTHSETPWVEARKGCTPSENCCNKISEEKMFQYYTSLLNEDVA